MGREWSLGSYLLIHGKRGWVSKHYNERFFMALGSSYKKREAETNNLTQAWIVFSEKAIQDTHAFSPLSLGPGTRLDDRKLAMLKCSKVARPAIHSGLSFSTQDDWAVTISTCMH